MKRDRGTVARATRHSRRTESARRLGLSGVSRVTGSSVLATITLACSMGPDGGEPSLVRNPLDPPPEYRQWWGELETCSGLHGDFWRVRFLEVVEPVEVGGRQFPCGGGQLCNGMWEAPHDITIAPRYVNHERLVKHEMLHDLVRAHGHPPVFESCDVTWEPGSGATSSHLPWQ